MATPMEALCTFSLIDKSGNELSKGEAKVQVENERLSILPKLGETVYLSLLDIVSFASSEYRLELMLSSGERLSVFDLGYKFTDLLTSLSAARNELILKYLLMNEAIKRSGVCGDLQIVDRSGVKVEFENCALRIYETSIVFIPTMAEPIRVHYANIVKLDDNDYALSVTSESGDRYTFSKMGMEFESIVRDLSNAINSLNTKSQALIKDLVPLADPSVIRDASRLLKDGKAASRSDLENISTEIWSALEKKLEQTPIWSSYEYLRSISRLDKIAAGIKRGLMGDLTGNYLWLLVPIYGASAKHGNAVALEAVRIESRSDDTPPPAGPETEGSAGGNATYFFRIAGRKEYPELSLTDIDAKVDGMVRTIDQLMLDINFRREPILLSDEQLKEPQHARYRYAAQKIASLKELRKLFIGRVIHSSFEQWRSDTDDLLSFNLSTNDDARWKRT